MLLRNPQPDPEFRRRFNEPTAIEIPAIPKQQDWTPPRYWRELLQVEETKFERLCKTWFVKSLFVLGTLYLLAVVSIFLYKLLMLVIELK